LCYTFVTEILHNVFSKQLFKRWYCGKGRLLQRLHGSFWRTFIGVSHILRLSTRVLILGRHCYRLISVRWRRRGSQGRRIQMIRPLGALDLKHSVLINEELGNAAFYLSFMPIASIATYHLRLRLLLSSSLLLILLFLIY